MKDAGRIPVVMFHSVDAQDPRWLWHELTCPLEQFSGRIDRFVAAGYRAADLDELYRLQAEGGRPAERAVVLTFDDGYLDNWVHVHPLLKRAGLRGIVYVNPEFIDPSETPRPTLEDVWAGRVSRENLQTRGFLNRAEIRLLDSEGSLAIGSHSMSHTWYPTGPEIVDFHRPGLDTPWLAWNARPERKPFYLTEDQSAFVPWGTPIHRHGRSLGIRRWFPDEAQSQACVAHVAANGGAAFFERATWREELASLAVGADRGTGRAETDAEMTDRFRYEIHEASRQLAELLGHPVTHFCWPGGAYCDASWDVAAASGFRTLTVKRSDMRRWALADPRLVRRISEHRQFAFMGRAYMTRDPGLLPLACDVELGICLAGWRLRVRKALLAATKG